MKTSITINSFLLPVVSTVIMTLSRVFQVRLKVSVSAILISSLICLPSRSGSPAVGMMPSNTNSDQNALQGRKMVLGSRPPGCVNKCMSCQPCKATLVIPPHQDEGSRKLAHREDDSYYLLSWKCRCGDKLFQP
ncbi:unnamed protein product [Coffea canephora]|uniref:Epidermal patterning factor-like protein n=1 Tax=Coffea canephora TaxID=49390 RepID=A0A068TQF3_COFCA|nr:unnamed protein product [Coffea canephora]